MNDTQEQDIPVARTEVPRGLSLVWLIPLVALLAGGWLVYKSISEKGPQVTIIFDQAEGLEAGKTRLKYKEVDVGKVKKITLTDDLESVVVTAELSKAVGYHLNENTRFWIVSPRISHTGISGLSTLISGIYIAMDPADGAGSPREFKGLEAPPEIDSDTEGRQFTLRAKTLGSLDIGAPVYYRQIEVGEVTQFELEDNGTSVRISIFVEEPYQDLVHTNSRFWNASGFNVNFDTHGISANLESLTALLAGGIAFDTPLNLHTGAIAPPASVFPLYEDIDNIDDQPYQRVDFYVMHFDSSVRGLNKGAPVEFRGIKVGEVMDINLQMDHESLDVKIPVIVGLHPERIRVNGDAGSTDEVMQTLVERGLRAQLKSGNLLSGQLYIDLEFRDNVPNAEILAEGPYRVFPTIPPTLEKITRNVSDLLDKFGNMPIAEMTNDLRDTIKSLKNMFAGNSGNIDLENIPAILKNIREISEKLNQNMDPLTDQLQSSLSQLESTLASTETVISEESPLYYDIRQLIEEVSSAARSFETLTDYLERHPNALLMGKPENEP